jgi:hypothetical protein
MRSDHQQPRGCFFVTAAPFLWVAITYLTIRLEFREFDLESWWIRSMVFMQLPLLIVGILPFVLIALFLMRGKHFSPWLRILIAVSPVLLATMPGVLSAANSPMRRLFEFQQCMDSPLPDDASNLKAWYSHSPGESSYMFSFRCSIESIEALIKVHPYQLLEKPNMVDSELDRFFELPIAGMAVPEGWPRPRDWTDLQVYRSEVTGGYLYLLISRNGRQVFILVGDT